MKLIGTMVIAAALFLAAPAQAEQVTLQPDQGGRIYCYVKPAALTYSAPPTLGSQQLRVYRRWAAPGRWDARYGAGRGMEYAAWASADKAFDRTTVWNEGFRPVVLRWTC